MNFVGKLQSQYESLWKHIIRPPRASYSEEALGPLRFMLEGVEVERKDFQMTSLKSNTFQGSLWLPSKSLVTPCVLYLHSSTGSRIEGMEYLGKLIKNGLGLCTFDFSGCGNAEGEYVSMGYYEQQEVAQVIQYLSSLEAVGLICLWGKEMGAVSALLALAKTLDVQAVVLDCPFKNLKVFIEERLRQQAKLPSLMVGGAVKMISKTIEEKAGFDVSNVNPYKFSAPGLYIPAFFAFLSKRGESEDDRKLFEAYGCKEKHCFFLEDKQVRNEDFVDNCLTFLSQHLGQTKEQETKQFDFFAFNNNNEKEKQINHNQKDRQTNPTKAEQHPKKEKEFSLKGIFSFFAGEESNQPQADTTENIIDSYTHLRKEIQRRTNNPITKTQENLFSFWRGEEKGDLQLENWVFQTLK